MSLRLHELHPVLVHLPLSALPAAVLCDAVALARRDPRLARLGSGLWTAAATGALLAGVAGLAASQEVRVKGERQVDLLFLHGLGNLFLSATAFSLAGWRLLRRPSFASCAAGVVATLAAGYTSYLGGELVYDHAVGVKRPEAPISREESPRLLSRPAPKKLVLDAKKGAAWLFAELGRRLAPRERPAAGPQRRAHAPKAEEIPFLH